MRFEFSAGGIVYKRKKNKTFVLIAQHSSHHGWVFPKGLIGDHVKNEGKEETALREVEEETGIKAKIIEPLVPETYWYVWEGERIKKTVYYFVMEYVSGDTKNHDWEMQKVEWLEKEEVLSRLTYASDKKVFKEALKLI